MEDGRSKVAQKMAQLRRARRSLAGLPNPADKARVERYIAELEAELEELLRRLAHGIDADGQ